MTKINDETELKIMIFSYGLLIGASITIIIYTIKFILNIVRGL